MRDIGRWRVMTHCGPNRRGAFTSASDTGLTSASGISIISPARRLAAKLLDLSAQSGLPRLEFGDRLVICSLVQQNFVDFIHKAFKVSNASTIVDSSFRAPGMIDAQLEQNIVIRTEVWDNTSRRQHAVEPSAAIVFGVAGLATANRGHVCHAEAPRLRPGRCRTAASFHRHKLIVAQNYQVRALRPPTCIPRMSSNNDYLASVYDRNQNSA